MSDECGWECAKELAVHGKRRWTPWMTFYRMQGDAVLALELGEGFGAGQCEIKWVTEGGLQFGAFCICKRMDLWLGASTACSGNAGVHGKHVDSDAFMAMDRWE